jgi:hypothetical protein
LSIERLARSAALLVVAVGAGFVALVADAGQLRFQGKALPLFTSVSRSHPKRLMNERRLSLMFCGVCRVGLNLAYELVPLTVLSRQGVGETRDSCHALVIGV